MLNQTNYGLGTTYIGTIPIMEWQGITTYSRLIEHRGLTLVLWWYLCINNYEYHVLGNVNVPDASCPDSDTLPNLNDHAPVPVTIP